MKALQLFETAQQGTPTYLETCIDLLKNCIKMEDVAGGKHIHSILLKSTSKVNIFKWNVLIEMYLKCGCHDDAHSVFERMSTRNVFTWTIMVAGYAQQGNELAAISLFKQMQHQDIEPNNVTLVNALSACTNSSALDEGKRIHSTVLRYGYSDVLLCNALVDFYIKGKRISEAISVFNSFPSRNVVSWNIMLAGASKNDSGMEAPFLFWQMQMEKVEPDRVTFITILSECAARTSVEFGKMFHAHTLKSVHILDAFVQNTLMDMYIKCCSMDNASQMFNKLSAYNVVSWNVMLSGCTCQGSSKEAVRFFCKMQEYVKPDQATFVNVLSACIYLGSIELGKWIHAVIMKAQYGLNIVVGSMVIDMYCKCGSIDDGCRMFDRLPAQDIVAWTAIVLGHAQHAMAKIAFKLFHIMLQDITADNIIFANLLFECATSSILEYGKWFHAAILSFSFELDVFLVAALIEMYVKCNSIHDAEQVFGRLSPSDVSWVAMIAGYIQHGLNSKALKLFDLMKENGLEPDCTAFTTILPVSVALMSISWGKWFHAGILKIEYERTGFVGSALVDMYGQCGSLQDADQIFDTVPERDIALWRSIITGHAHHGDANGALKLYEYMRYEDMKPDNIILVTVLGACSEVASLEGVKLVYTDVLEMGVKLNVHMGNALVHAYAKCGNLGHAQEIFNNMDVRDVISWTTMVSAHAQHGNGLQALEYFRSMKLEHVNPDKLSFIAILFACSHSSLVDEGCFAFSSITEKHGLATEHYACMVDLVGRAGYLEEAVDIISTMPVDPSAEACTSVLSAHTIHGCEKQTSYQYAEKPHLWFDCYFPSD